MQLQTSVLLSMWIAGLALASGLASRSSTEPSAVGDLDVKIREWDVPTKGAHPHDPAVAPDGSLWFTEQMVSKLGRLDPATGDFKEYPLKGKNDGPHGLVADSDGNIYIADSGASVIYRVGPAGNLGVFAGQAGNSGYGGDNGPAAKALLNGPVALGSSTESSLSDWWYSCSLAAFMPPPPRGR